MVETKLFQTWEEVSKNFPGAAQLVGWENKIQYPDAKFLECVLSTDPNDGEVELHIFFDIGLLTVVLWVWVHGTLEQLSNIDYYIDEYSEVTIEKARQLGLQV